jgi:hypothetical protein
LFFLKGKYRARKNWCCVEGGASRTVKLCEFWTSFALILNEMGVVEYDCRGVCETLLLGKRGTATFPDVLVLFFKKKRESLNNY